VSLAKQANSLKKEHSQLEKLMQESAIKLQRSYRKSKAKLLNYVVGIMGNGIQEENKNFKQKALSNIMNFFRFANRFRSYFRDLKDY